MMVMKAEAVRISQLPPRQILGHGHPVRRPVGRTGGAEHELPDPGGGAGFEEFDAIADIVGIGWCTELDARFCA